MPLDPMPQEYIEQMRRVLRAQREVARPVPVVAPRTRVVWGGNAQMMVDFDIAATEPLAEYEDTFLLEPEEFAVRMNARLEALQRQENEKNLKENSENCKKSKLNYLKLGTEYRDKYYKKLA